MRLSGSWGPGSLPPATSCASPCHRQQEPQQTPAAGSFSPCQAASSCWQLSDLFWQPHCLVLVRLVNDPFTMLPFVFQFIFPWIIDWLLRLTIVNNVDMNLSVQICFWVSAFSALENMHSQGTARLRCNSNFLRRLHTAYHSGHIILHFSSNMQGFPFLHSHQYLLFFVYDFWKAF